MGGDGVNLWFRVKRDIGSAVPDLVAAGQSLPEIHSGFLEAFAEGLEALERCGRRDVYEGFVRRWIDEAYLAAVGDGGS